MDVEPLTPAEQKWLKQFQALMNKCPSKRLGAFTTGDPYLSIYDKPVFDGYREEVGNEDRDDVEIHHQLGTVLATVTMPFQVDGVAG